MPICCVAGFEKVRLVRSRDFSSPGAMRARRGIAARYIKANSSIKGRGAFFPTPGLEIAMEAKLLEINEILERKDINDKHKP
jgi:L-alanine-DL-glutamate epimerase-like enolase superfamily enzyme